MFNTIPTDQLINHVVKSELPTNTLVRHHFNFIIIPKSSRLSDKSYKTKAAETLKKIDIPKRGAA